MRTLESLYWLGVQILLSEVHQKELPFYVGQWDPYLWLDKIGPEGLPSAIEALEAVLDAQIPENFEVVCNTKLLIVPGYQFQLYVFQFLVWTHFGLGYFSNLPWMTFVRRICNSAL